MDPLDRVQWPLQLRTGDSFYLERDKSGRLATGFKVCSTDSARESSPLAGTGPPPPAALERKRRRRSNDIYGVPGLDEEIQRGPNVVLNTPGFLSDIHACFWSRAHISTLADLAVKAGAKRDYSACPSTTHVVLK